MPFVPKKLYYKIREVCEIVGVEAHVLRFLGDGIPGSFTAEEQVRPADLSAEGH